MLNRRRFLKLAGITALATAAPRIPLAFGGDEAEHGGLLHLTATEAVRHISEGSLSAETYARALLAQAERLNFLDTIISIDPDAVLEAAHQVDMARRRGRRLGPLAGLPLLVKDNIDTKALPTTAGTPGLLSNRPTADAPVLNPLFQAGALLFAKANMHELAFGITSHNYHFGAVHNPYDATLIPGGSSGGTGAGIAARLCPAGVGTDTGGSVRIPAALCGVVGLRPTKGRYSITRIVPISHTRDTPGPMGRTVADVALLDAVETGTTPARPTRLRGLRLGVPRDPFWQDLDPELAAVMDDALHRLRALGVVLVEVDVPGITTLDQQAGFPIALYEANIDIPAYLAAEGNGITFDDIQRQIASPDVAGAIAAARGGAIPQPVYEHALNVVRPELQALYASYFADNGVTAMVFPTTVLPARPIGQDQTVELNGRQVDTFTTFIRNTDADAVAGIPGLSMPAGRTRSGLPVGMELDGPMGSDRLLLSIGLALEESAFRPLQAPKLAG
ncbi:MAG: indoleacetamide hydrolase [Candidatus Rokuibacteriota bacterium]|nr:MAG: indoleacetamide hydrolase [Candidatus Rokubacteria bacterium]